MMLKNNEINGKETCLVNASCLEHIRAIYEMDPEMAGQLAISYFEYIFTGSYSFEDNPLIKMNMIDFMKFTDRSKEKYNTKVDNDRLRRIQSKELDVIASGLQQGLKKEAILDLMKNRCSMSTLYDRIAVIKRDYPELLEDDTAPGISDEPQVIYTSDFEF